MFSAAPAAARFCRFPWRPTRKATGMPRLNSSWNRHLTGVRAGRGRGAAVRKWSAAAIMWSTAPAASGLPWAAAATTCPVRPDGI